MAKELNIEEKFVSVSIEDIEKENWSAHMEHMKGKKCLFLRAYKEKICNTQN